MFEMKILNFTEIAILLSMAFICFSYAIYAFVGYIIYRCITSHYFYQVRSSLRRDLSGLALLVRLKVDIRRRMIANQPLHEIFLSNVRKYYEKIALIETETGRTFTFNELNICCNKYAQYFQAQGYKNNEVISLFLENCTDFIAIWIALSKIGVITAWINTNLTSCSLAHSITTSHSKSVITSKTLLPVLKDLFLSGRLEKMKVYVVDDEFCDKDNIISLPAKVDQSSISEPIVENNITFKSILCYIFTSGTTGNPKPALIKHYRYYWMAMGVSKAFGIVSSDRIYVMMPLYHSAGGILGVGQSVINGCTTVIRKKFSARNFWKDCVKYDCTVGQYIGEICRYLLAQENVPEEKQHKIRVLFGNGLRENIWSEFVNRFGIEKIGELYGSTEGNSSIVNIDNRVGSCGFIPVHPYVKYLYPVRLLKVNEETGQLLRNRDGLCVSCNPGESGEMAGAIKPNEPLLSFEGYVNVEDTDKKIIKDVLYKGDTAFTTGDIMYWDDLGYLYFKDRLGDTYRWKGENISTTEVEGVFQFIRAVSDVAVYGVNVPGREGRAGMAAILLSNNVSPDSVVEEIAFHIQKSLPSYAIPIFLRFCRDFDRTGTYKLKKITLRKEGFDLKMCNSERIFIWEADRKLYKQMDAEIQLQIEKGLYGKI